MGLVGQMEGPRKAHGEHCESRHQVLLLRAQLEDLRRGLHPEGIELGEETARFHRWQRKEIRQTAVYAQTIKEITDVLLRHKETVSRTTRLRRSEVKPTQNLNAA